MKIFYFFLFILFSLNFCALPPNQPASICRKKADKYYVCSLRKKTTKLGGETCLKWKKKKGVTLTKTHSQYVNDCIKEVIKLKNKGNFNLDEFMKKK